MAGRWPGGVVLALALVLSPVGSESARAQSKVDPPVIAVVDVQRILRDSTAVKSLNERIENLRSAYQDDLKKKEEQLRAENQELIRQRTILAADVFAQRRGELEQRVAGLQREAQSRKRAVDQQFSSGMSQIQKSITKIATDIAAAQGFDMVLNGAAAVIFKPEYDITDEVISELNKTLTEVELPSLQN